MLDRRTRRSEDIITALHYQLSATRRMAELDAVVLVDDSGCLVAGAGAWPICEELAAYAPLLAHPWKIGNAIVGSRGARLKCDVEVHAIEIDGCEVILCGSGGSAERSACIERAADGCRRILGAA